VEEEAENLLGRLEEEVEQEGVRVRGRGWVVGDPPTPRLPPQSRGGLLENPTTIVEGIFPPPPLNFLGEYVDVTKMYA
jgi:hypothetical protein